MNNAGLPGTGLGGLFYILLALWMPVAELHATLRGRSSRARWRQVGTQVALAVGIIAAVAATVAVYLRLMDTPRVLGLHGSSLALAPVVLAAILLSGLVLVLRLWARILARTQTPPLVGPPSSDSGALLEAGAGTRSSERAGHNEGAAGHYGA